MKKIISALLILTMIFSMVCISTSADGGQIYINENFAGEESFLRNFTAGDYYVADGLLFGYESAKALQSEYYQDENGIFDNTGNTWLTYDASISVAIGVDEGVADGAIKS